MAGARTDLARCPETGTSIRFIALYVGNVPAEANGTNRHVQAE